jgi:DNA polymerase III subunit epsilon
MLFGLKKYLSRGGSAAHLPDDLRAAITAWQKSEAPKLDEAHFHVRYVVVDIATSGSSPDKDELLGVAASGVVRAGKVGPEDAFYLDFASLEGDDAAVDRQLMAFLQYTAKAPLVTYHVSYVGGFLQRIYKERLGIDFQPQWVDLAWLLPAMFDDKAHTVLPLNQWVELFGLDNGEGRRDAMDNTLMLARIFQMLLVRANGKEIGTAERLINESHASSFLRRTH